MRAAWVSGGLVVFFALMAGSPVVVKGDEATPSVRALAAPADLRPVRALQESNGTVHLVADSSHGPMYAQSTDYGKTFSKPQSLVDEASRQPGLEFQVWDATLGPDGRLFVALGTNAWKLKLPKEQWGFHLAIRDPKSGVIAPVRNINRKPSEGFSLAANEQGKVVACWLADKLYANISLDGGKTFGDTVEIDPSFNPCNCCTTTCTFLPDGRVAILYREETNNDRDMFVVYWDLEKRTAVKKPVSTTSWKIDACPMTYYSLARSGSGLLAAWPTRKSIFFARLDEAGRLAKPGEVKTAGISGMRTGLTTLENRAGTMLLVWNEEGRVGWQTFDRQGKAADAPATKSTRGKGVAAFIDASGGFIVLH